MNIDITNAKPILFSADMVQAIWAGRKTMTRRVVNPQNITHYRENCPATVLYNMGCNDWACPKCGGGVIPFTGSSDIHAKYIPEEILYVRETWAETPKGYIYKADNHDYMGKWKPSIHMPKNAARIFLRVTDVSAERLQGITETDAMDEGATPEPPFSLPDSYRRGFIALWDSIYSKRDGGIYKWESNCWVWVYSFERIEI